MILLQESIRFQLKELEKMALDPEREELQKKVSQFVVDSLNKLEELQIDPMYSTQLLSVLASGYPVVTLTEDNAKWKMNETGDLEHFLCKHVIKRNGQIFNTLGYVFFEPESDRGFTDKTYSMKKLELPCPATALNPVYLQLKYKLNEKSLEDQVKTLIDYKQAKETENEHIRET